MSKIAKMAACRWSLVVGFGLGLSGSISNVMAEGFRLDRYQTPPSAEDGLATWMPSTLGHLRLSARLVVDYAHRPLQFTAAPGIVASQPAVDGAWNTDLAIALGLGKHFEVHASLPVTLFQDLRLPSGGSASLPSSTALGDILLGTSVHILGEAQQGVSLGLAANLGVPTGNTGAYAGDDGLTGSGRLIAAFAHRRFSTAINLGAAYRPEQQIGPGAESGPELLVGGMLQVPVGKSLALAAELHGTSLFSNLMDEASTPMETLFSAHLALGGGIRTGAGVGAGLSEAAGVPSVRGLVFASYASPIEVVKIASDRDQDGFEDSSDGCPDDPEDKDGFEDQDGCPDLDNDSDKIADSDDACPLSPEDYDGQEDEDGCPEADVEPEPEPVPVPEPEVEDEPAPTWKTYGIVSFSKDSAKLPSEILKTLDEVKAAMNADPDLRLNIDGHTSMEGGEDHNYRLGLDRAKVVKRWLVKRGVSGKRLNIRSFGAKRPVNTDDSESAYQQNRRVEFTTPLKDLP